MLEKVTDKDMLSNAIIKHIKKNVFTNSLLYSQEYDNEIKSNSLYIKECESNNMFLLKMRDSFAILYYYINDQTAFFKDMANLKEEIKGKKIVTEIAYKYGQDIDLIASMFYEMKFIKAINRVCLEKNSLNQIEISKLEDGIHLQNDLLDENTILKFLKENFDEYTGCIPLNSTIKKRTENGELLVLEEDFTRKTIGLLEYSTDNRLTIKHLAISKEYRGKGLAKFLLDTLSNKGKQIITWTTDGSEAEKIYIKNGFIKTTYKSIVLIYKEE